MKTIKVSEATYTQLDGLVAQCEGAKGLRMHTYAGIDPGPPVLVVDWAHGWTALVDTNYTTDPSLMHPIIEREGISTVFQGDAHEWVASLWNYNTQDWHMHKTGATPLIAAARCYVVSCLGEEVEVPEELT